MKRFADRKRQNKVLTVGQKVWLSASNLAIKRPSKKLSPKREGPFKITKLAGQEVYELALPKGWKIHNVFHVSKLFPAEGDPTEFDNEELELDEEQSTNWVVNEILDLHQLLDRVEYYVSWVNMPASENSWE